MHWKGIQKVSVVWIKTELIENKADARKNWKQPNTERVSNVSILDMLRAPYASFVPTSFELHRTLLLFPYGLARSLAHARTFTLDQGWECHAFYKLNAYTYIFLIERLTFVRCLFQKE